VRFDPKTMRLSVRQADHSSTFCGSVWTRALVSFGGPALLATGKGATSKEARAAVLAALRAAPAPV